MRSFGTALCLVLVGCGAASADPGEEGDGTGGTSGAAGVGGASAAGSTGSGGKASGSGGSVGSGGGSGGSTAGGGMTDAGTGRTPHVVVPCDSAQVGVWEEITPPGVRANADFSAQKGFGTNAFVMDRTNTANITIGTDHIGVHRTTDCGASWTKINTGKNGAALDGGTQWSMAIDPVDPNVVYTVSGYGTMGLFKTTNAGIDWEQTYTGETAHVFTYDGFTAQVRVDPVNHLHVVTTPHFTCQAGHSNTCFLESEDGAATWSVVENAPSSGEGARIMLADHDTWFSGMGYGGLYRTSNAGKTWTLLTSDQSYAYEPFHRPGQKYYLPVAFGLSVSTDGVAWNQLANSPGTHIVTTSDKRIYAATGGWYVSGHTEPFNPITSAPIDNPATWTVDTGYSNKWGSGDLQYDADHHMLYTSNGLGGFWRVRTE
jgi:hypothetical protein